MTGILRLGGFRRQTREGEYRKAHPAKTTGVLTGMGGMISLRDKACDNNGKLAFAAAPLVPDVPINCRLLLTGGFRPNLVP